jgi:hypothetical protein
MVGRIATGEIEESTPPADDGKDPAASPKAGVKMSFVVQADPLPGQSAFIAEKLTRYAAIETALGLIEDGMTSVTIRGESGRVSRFQPAGLTHVRPPQPCQNRQRGLWIIRSEQGAQSTGGH